MTIRKTLLIGGALGACALAQGMASAAFAQNGEAQGDGTYTFVLENDWMFNQDRDYSNGLRFDYVSGESAPGEGWTGTIARRFLGADGQSMVRTGISLNHLMFVPNDTDTTGVPAGQHPYGGYLGGQYTVFEQRGNTLEQVSFSLGVIGPEAQAEELQDAFHDIFDDDMAQGWESQTGTEVGLAVSYDRAQKVFVAEGPLGFGADVIAHGGGTVGTTLTQANAGASVRIGKDLGDDFLPPRLFPYTGAGFWDNDSLASAYLFAGVEGRAVLSNIFLDGGFFTDGPSVDKENFVGDMFLGAAVQLWIGQVSFTYQERGQEYETQDAPQKIGSIAFSASF